MTIDITVIGSPGWWMHKAARKLRLRLPRLEKLASYHDGNPPLPNASDNVRDAYKTFQKKARTNFAELIVGSTRERCTVRAIRTAFGETLDGDSAAWDIWRDNNLDVEFSDVIENMLALGDSYMIVGLDPEDETKVLITGEDPRQVVTIHNPARQSEVRAALKLFHDPDVEKDYAFLYLRGEKDDDGKLGNARRYVASRDRRTRATGIPWHPASYSWDEDFGGADGEELNHPLVPVVRFRNRRGIGEFEPHTDVLDRINHTLLMRMVITQYQAFKQRALQVNEEDMPDQDENDKDIDYSDILTADPGAWLKIPFNSKVWESTQAELQGILSSIKDDVQHLAAVTRTPLSVVSPDAANQSAEGAALIKEGQIFKTEDKQKRAGAGLVDVYVLAFLALGDSERSDKRKIVVDWAPAERFSLSQKYSAAAQAPTAGVPRESIWGDILQKTPEQVELMKQQAIDDQVAADLVAPPVPPVRPVPKGEPGGPAPAPAPDPNAK